MSGKRFFHGHIAYVHVKMHDMIGNVLHHCERCEELDSNFYYRWNTIQNKIHYLTSTQLSEFYDFYKDTPVKSFNTKDIS